MQQGQGSPQALLLGCGYSGLALGARLAAQGVQVVGTVRDATHKGEPLRAAHITPVSWTLGQPVEPCLRALGPVPVDIIYMIPPARGPAGADPLEPMRAALDALCDKLDVRALLYVGATSVYGDAHGGVVSAQTPRLPRSPHGKARAASEDLCWELGAQRGLRAMLARLPGIYGPERSVLERLRDGSYLLVDGGHKWTARIHRDDIAMGLEVLLAHGQGGQAYVLCDDTPFQVREMVAWACQRLGLPWPREVSLEDYTRQHGEFAASFWRTSNRYDNRHIRCLPGFSLAYPSFREGYEALLQGER